MLEAFLIDEMSVLGDMRLGTTPPLRLRFLAAAEEPAIIEDGLVRFKIGRVRFLCGDNEIVEPLDEQLVWALAQFGEWVNDKEAYPIVLGNRLRGLEFEWTLRERANDQRFEMIGSLSRMFSRYYALQTLSEGSLDNLEARKMPEWVTALSSSDYKSKALPLWRFICQPAGSGC